VIILPFLDWDRGALDCIDIRKGVLLFHRRTIHVIIFCDHQIYTGATSSRRDEITILTLFFVYDNTFINRNVDHFQQIQQTLDRLNFQLTTACRWVEHFATNQSTFYGERDCQV
jgi:hypothetical protein